MVQSDPLLDVVTPIQLDVELVKVEMVVMTEDEHGEEEETGVGQTLSPAEQEVCDEGSSAGRAECAAARTNLETDK